MARGGFLPDIRGKVSRPTAAKGLTVVAVERRLQEPTSYPVVARKGVDVVVEFGQCCHCGGCCCGVGGRRMYRRIRATCRETLLLEHGVPRSYTLSLMVDTTDNEESGSSAPQSSQVLKR